MAIREDPEENEIRSLLAMAPLEGQSILEIGCGVGRLTWRYATKAAHVLAIEPFEPSFRQAKENIPGALQDRVDLRNLAFADFAAGCSPASYDVVILSWSLC
jgi:2-polyprenyl-3-methyl-5-hydroxy-6-metoxy-1,4-benzoquinol methylase